MVFEFDFFKNGTEIPEITRHQVAAIHKAAYMDGASLPVAVWEEERRGGIGGSDVSAIMGDSPFQSNWNVFLDKTHIAMQDMSDNWFRLAYGHATEPLIAELFARKFKARIINETGMFKHPHYDFIRANLDRLAILPTGELVILECKSSNPFSESAWAKGVPVYYEWQGRQYLCVINQILANAGLPEIKKIYYSCLYGNTEENAVFRKVEVDKEIENKMLECEKDFWQNHVIPKILPLFNGSGKKFKEMNISYRMELSELASINTNNVIQAEETENHLDSIAQNTYDQLIMKKAEIKAMKQKIEAVNEDVNRLEGELFAALHGQDSGILPSGITVSLTTKSTRSTDFELMKEVYPEVYAECVTEGRSSPSLSFKKPSRSTSKKKAAENAAHNETEGNDKSVA